MTSEKVRRSIQSQESLPQTHNSSYKQAEYSKGIPLQREGTSDFKGTSWPSRMSKMVTVFFAMTFGIWVDSPICCRILALLVNRWKKRDSEETVDLTCSNRPKTLRNRLRWFQRLYLMYRLTSQLQIVAEISAFEDKVSTPQKVKVFQRDSLCFT